MTSMTHVVVFCVVIIILLVGVVRPFGMYTYMNRGVKFYGKFL